MLSLLQKPMPFSRGLKKEILYICATGICALLFFYLVRPVGFAGLSNISLFGYGLVCIAVAILYVTITHYLYRRYWGSREWTIGLEILHSLFFLFFIGAGILMYSYLIHHLNLDIKNALLYLLYTLLLGAVPVVIRAILVRNWRLNKDLLEVKKINELLRNRKAAMNEKLFEFPVSQKEILKITNQDLLYIESAENYITVVWSANNNIKKNMIRMTMKDAIRQVDDPFIVFCHRSFIINLRKVREIIPQQGAAAVVLEGLETLIPVSNTFKAQVKEKLLEI